MPGTCGRIGSTGLNCYKKFQIVANFIFSTGYAVFEIALVRLSETSDYLPGQVNNPSAVIRWTSDKLQPSADFRSNAFEVDTNLGHYE